jgi:WD40 repeat protein
VGTLSGLLIKFRDKLLENSCKAHEGSVNVICSENHAIFVTGGDDEFLKFWNLKLVCEKKVNIETELSKMTQNIGITSISESENGTLLIALRSGEILTTKPSKMDPESKKKILVTGHCQGELTSVAVSTKNPTIFTVSTNGLLFKWDYLQKKLLQTKKLEFPPVNLDLMFNNNYLAVGCKNGMIQIIDPDSLQIAHTINSSKSENTVLKFTHSNELLAAGFNDGDIHLFSMLIKCELVRKLLPVSKSPIRSLDFSDDSTILRVEH